MTLSEFKAWFEGFTENMEGPPNKKQWARIQKRVEQITANPVSVTHYVTREIKPYWNQPVWCGATTIGAGISNASSTAADYNALGQADAALIAHS